MNILLSFKDDHAVILDLLQQAVAEKTLDDGGLQKICDTLLFHLEMEEIVFESLQHESELQDAVCMALQGHACIRGIIREIFQCHAAYKSLYGQIASHLSTEEADAFMAELQQGDKSRDRVFSHVQDLLESFRISAQEEETAIFPKMPRSLPDPLLAQLSQEFLGEPDEDTPCQPASEYATQL